MTINSPYEFCAGLWDWQILDGCFGQSKIKPTDIDGFVERGGRFLVIETKRPGATIPYGQQLTFEALRRTGLFTIFVVWGETNKPCAIQVMTRHEIRPSAECDVEKLRRLTMGWYEWANSQVKVAGG